jgi:hypothetical protein
MRQIYVLLAFLFVALAAPQARAETGYDLW